MIQALLLSGESVGHGKVVADETSARYRHLLLFTDCVRRWWYIQYVLVKNVKMCCRVAVAVVLVGLRHLREHISLVSSLLIPACSSFSLSYLYLPRLSRIPFSSPL